MESIWCGSPWGLPSGGAPLSGVCGHTVTKKFDNAGKKISVKVDLFPWERLDAVEAVKKVFGL